MTKGSQPLTKRQRIVVMSAVAFVIAALVGFVMYDFWAVSQKTQAILKAPGIITTSDDEKAGEGSDTTALTKDDLAAYTVAPDAPRILQIDRLGIAARIRPMGLNSDKSIQAPKNINDAGWYMGSAKPDARGALFIDGHASGATRLGLFAYLDTLEKGDMVRLEKGDGTKLSYRVVNVAVVPLESIDMGKILVPYPGVEKGLNLMTCTGVWAEDAETLDHRVVVYTEQL